MSFSAARSGLNESMLRQGVGLVLEVGMNACCSYKYSSTLKSAVFGSSSFLPPLTGVGGVK